MEKTTTVSNQEIYPGYTKLITNPAKDSGVESEDRRLVVIASQIRIMVEELMRYGFSKNMLDRSEGKPATSDPLVAAFNGNGFNVRFFDEHPDDINLESLIAAMRRDMRGILPDSAKGRVPKSGKFSENVLVTALAHPDAYDVLNTERFSDDFFATRESTYHSSTSDQLVPTRVRPDRFRTEESPLVMLNQLASRHGQDGLHYMLYDNEKGIYMDSIAPGSFDRGCRLFC